MKLFLTAYADETVAAGAGSDTVVAGAGSDTINAGGGTDDLKPKFNQKQLNDFLAEDRRKHKVQIEKTVTELENVKKSNSITTKEREALQVKIDELQNSMLTKEELAAKEREKIEKNYKSQLDTVTTEKESWYNRFNRSTIETAIVSEAVKAEAFDPDALIAMLGPNTRLLQENDDEGKPIERFTPKVKFNDTDKDGKPITLDLTVEQTVKRMKEIPKYGYLFKSTAKAGLGGTNLAGGGDKFDITKATHEQYLAQRPKMGLAKVKKD